jgi:two-component system, cell cycle sensor histidine kinase and response regulator CckA
MSDSVPGTTLPESWLRSALGAARFAAWEWDLATGELRWSSDLHHLQSLGAITGPEDADRTRIHPEDRPRLRASLQASLETGDDLEVEFRVIRPDGRVTWKEARGRPRIGSDGAPSGLAGIAQDITRRREAELRLRMREDELAEIQQVAQLGSWSWNLDVERVTWSRQLRRIFGVDADEGAASYAAFLDLVHPEDRGRVAETIDGAVRRGGGFEVEHRMIRPDGAERVMRCVGRRAIDPVTGHRLLTGTGQDITGIHTARIEARAQERIASLFDSVSDACFLLDHAWRFTHLNRKAQESLSRGVDELLGAVIGEELPWLVAAPFQEAYERALRTGEGVTFEERFEPTGTWHEIHACPTGEGLAVFFRDVTERKNAELALRESEARFRRLVEHAADAIIVHDLEGTILLVNGAACRAFGYSREELLGEVGLVDVDPICTPAFLRGLWPDLVRERAITAISTHRRKDGSTYPAEIRVGVLDDDPDRPVIVGLSRDVTSRRDAELALARSELHFRSLIENALDMITVVDEQGAVRYASPSHERILGYPVNALVGQNIRSIIHPDDLPPILRGIEELAGEAGAVLRQEIRVRHADGHWLVLEVAGSNLQEEGVEGLVVNSRDVTDRRAAEEALRASEERYRRFFQEDLTGDFITDADGRIADCNGAFARVFGFGSVEAALAASVYELYPSRTHRRRFLEQVRTHGKVENATLELRRVDGTTVHAVVNAIGDFDEYGHLRSLRGYLFDITEQKRLEDQLRHSQKLEAVGRLAGGIAHDFNNLMTAVLGHAELLLLDAEGPLREDLEEIRASAHRAAALTRQLLAFSRRQTLQPRVLELNAAVREMEGMLRRLMGSEIEFQTLLEADTGRVQADPSQIEQVLVNLAVNARDAMPGGGRITLRTADRVLGEGDRSRYPFLLPGPYVMLEMEDTGHGMDAATLGRVFEPFFTTKDQGKGTGLGLATVYGIVKQSGGFILAESEPGDGARFTIYLPHATEAVPAEEEAPSSPLHVGSAGAETVVVVEDEEAVREVVRRALETRGFRVVAVRDGEEALRLGEEMLDRVDVLLTDLRMPRLGGEALARALRLRHPSLRVLFMSGYAGGAGGPDDGAGTLRPFLQKPFSPEEVVLAVRAVLEP